MVGLYKFPKLFSCRPVINRIITTFVKCFHFEHGKITLKKSDAPSFLDSRMEAVNAKKGFLQLLLFDPVGVLYSIELKVVPKCS